MNYESPADFSVIQRMEEIKGDYEERIEDMKEEIEQFKLKEEQIKRDMENMQMRCDADIEQLKAAQTKEIEDLIAKYRNLLSKKESENEDMRKELESYKRDDGRSGKKSKFF
jgi:hypothetical protein